MPPAVNDTSSHRPMCQKQTFASPGPAGTAAELWLLQCTLSNKERRLAFELLSSKARTPSDHGKAPGLSASAQHLLDTIVATRNQRLSPALRARLQSSASWSHDVIGIHELIVSCGKSPLLGAPLALSFRGDRLAFQARSVAIIGSRQPTYQGRRIAHDYARALAESGVFIWSGGAIGIDTVALLGGLSTTSFESPAHQTTPEPRARVGAILGSGLDCPYPPSNRLLFARPDVVTVSEFECFQRAQPWCFPARNFTLAWIADYVLVIESQRNSGSLITADCAAQLGTGVGAIVWPPEHPLAAGNQSLIDAGADPILSPDDVLSTLSRLAPAPRGAARALDLPPLPNTTPEAEV